MYRISDIGYRTLDGVEYQIDGFDSLRRKTLFEEYKESLKRLLGMRSDKDRTNF